MPTYTPADGLIMYTVPGGINYLQVQAWGGKGGGGPGRSAGYVSVTMPVTPGNQFTIVAGPAGGISAGGLNPPNPVGGHLNGGDGGTIGGGGGGAGSYMYPGHGAFPGPDSCSIISGGGGGGSGGGTVGGFGGGDPAQNAGSAAGATGGGGANGTTPGAAGIGTTNNGTAGNVNGTGGKGGDEISGAGGGGGGGRRGGGGGGSAPGTDGGNAGGGGGGNGFILDPLWFDPINVTALEEGYVDNIDEDFGGKVIITELAMVCVAEGSLVQLATGQEQPIQELRPGQCAVGAGGAPVPLERIVRFNIPIRRFVQIGAGSLGQSLPNRDLLICPGHPILFNGREVLPEELLGVPRVVMVELEKPLHYYTLITEERTFLEIQGLKVATWSRAGWDNARENDSVIVCPFRYLTE